MLLRLAKVDTDGLMSGYDQARLPGLWVDAGANVGWITGKIFAQAGDLILVERFDIEPFSDFSAK